MSFPSLISISGSVFYSQNEIKRGSNNVKNPNSWESENCSCDFESGVKDSNFIYNIEHTK